MVDGGGSGRTVLCGVLWSKGCIQLWTSAAYDDDDEATSLFDDDDATSLIMMTMRLVSY